MPLILQRAKIVLDLGMPGPERISGEALLFGCIPVVSERWNGASRVDFPGEEWRRKRCVSFVMFLLIVFFA